MWGNTGEAATRSSRRKAKLSVAVDMDVAWRMEMLLFYAWRIRWDAADDSVRRRRRYSRILTLTGAGGCGKTRLALQVANELLEEFADGVWVVDLAPLSEPELVKNSVASVLRVQEGSERSLMEVLSDYVRSRQLCCCWITVSTSSQPVPDSPRHCCRRPLTCAS
jgi:SpoVK/Ycf46/Vps4 family AAA+-type ATPase